MDNEKLRAAIQFRTEERYEEAEKLFHDLLAVYPNDAEASYHTAWLYDKMGRERDAVPHYERAIELGLGGEDLRGVLLGLGSTYRTLGDYSKAVGTLKQGMTTFPDAKEFPVFLAMALYNTGEHKEAVSLLLNVLLETTNDANILGFKRAIVLYAEDLDKTWE